MHKLILANEEVITFVPGMLYDRKATLQLAAYLQS
jgi:hypothetical protein